MRESRTHTKVKLLALLTCCIALCLALVGCGGGGGQKSEDYSKNFIGEWEASEVVDEGDTVDSDTMALVKSMGMTCTLSLKEDKSATLNIFDEKTEGTWEAKSATECKATFSDGTMDGKIDGEKLLFSDSDTSITFVKAGTLPEASSSGSATTDGALSGANSAMSKEKAMSQGTVIADDELCTIVVMGPKYNTGTGFPLMIYNNSADTELYFVNTDDVWTIGGAPADYALLAEEVEAGESAEGFLWVERDDITDPADLVNVTGIIEVWNNDTLDTLRTYDFAI